MSANLEVTRRQFLKATALAGGGFMIGFRFGGEAVAAALDPNAWVKLDADGAVTLVCQRNEMGQDVHTSLTMLLAEELGVDPRRVKVVQAAANPVYVNNLLGAQITGGSTSVRDAWETLRRAGATTRVMLVNAAAAEWKVPASEIRAQDGELVHGARKVSFGAMAGAAARQPVPADVTLKAREQFAVIGKPLPRLDGADKARGKTVYGIDVVQPGMVHAALAACPVLGGKVASFDAAAAEKRSGVKKVVNIGEGVAVVADHYWTARKALGDVRIQWDEGPTARLDSAAIYAALDQAKDKPGAVVKQAGDTAAAFAKGAPVEARYTLQMLAHATLEPQNCVARVSADGVDVWMGTQFPQGAQGVAAEVGGVKPEQVRIHPQFIGGGFGRRLDLDLVAQTVAIAKAMPGTPVKLIWSREDDMTHDFYRPPSLHLMRGVVEQGRIAALSTKMISPSITARMFPGFVKDGLEPFMTEGTANLTYDIPNLDLRSVIQEVGVRVGYWRSVSNALNAFAIESFIDELANASGTDPVALRLAMLDKMPRQRAVIERVARDSGYRAKAGNGRAFGIASMECYGTHVAMVAEVSGGADKVKLEKLSVCADIGLAVHPDQVVAQLEGGAVTGLINTLRSKIKVKDGRVVQTNFHDFRLPRMSDVPPIAVTVLESGGAPGGIGEVGVPLVAPAVANAVFALTGKRIRSLPLEDGGVTFA
ncbi:MAG: molybdopterin cofactor-binding domain-containing protein [Usitatibacter sp.]